MEVTEISKELLGNHLGFIFTTAQEFLLTLPREHSNWNAWVTELDEGPTFIDAQSISGQQNIFGTNKAVDQLFVLL